MTYTRRWSDVLSDDGRGVLNGKILKLLAAFVKHGVIVRVDAWAQYVEESGGKIYEYLVHHSSNTFGPFNREVHNRIYYADHALTKWMEGNPRRYDINTVEHFIHRLPSVDQMVVPDIIADEEYMAALQFIYDQAGCIPSGTSRCGLLLLYYGAWLYFRQHERKVYVDNGIIPHLYYLRSRELPTRQVSVGEIVEAIINPPESTLQMVSNHVFGQPESRESKEEECMILRAEVQRHVLLFVDNFPSYLLGLRDSYLASSRVIKKGMAVNRGIYMSEGLRRAQTLNVHIKNASVQTDDPEREAAERAQQEATEAAGDTTRRVYRTFQVAKPLEP